MGLCQKRGCQRGTILAICTAVLPTVHGLVCAEALTTEGLVVVELLVAGLLVAGLVVAGLVVAGLVVVGLVLVGLFKILLCGRIAHVPSSSTIPRLHASNTASRGRRCSPTSVHAMGHVIRPGPRWSMSILSLTLKHTRRLGLRIGLRIGYRNRVKRRVRKINRVASIFNGCTNY